jgi:hypothetical protein
MFLALPSLQVVLYQEVARVYDTYPLLFLSLSLFLLPGVLIFTPLFLVLVLYLLPLTFVPALRPTIQSGSASGIFTTV